MDDVARIDQELRAEMVEAQAQVARFTTEHKQAVDTIALQATRTLENDKGVWCSGSLRVALGAGAPSLRSCSHLARAPPRRREPSGEDGRA